MHDMMEGRYYGQLKDLISDRSRWMMMMKLLILPCTEELELVFGDRIASENACKKPAGNSRRLKKKPMRIEEVLKVWGQSQGQVH